MGSPNGVSCARKFFSTCQRNEDQSFTGMISILILQITDETFRLVFCFLFAYHPLKFLRL